MKRQMVVSIMMGTNQDIEGSTMNSATVGQEEALSQDLKRTWNNLAGIIRRRCPVDADRIIPKTKDSLFCALAGTSKAKMMALGRTLSINEQTRLLKTYRELSVVIKGEDGDPGLPSEDIEAEVGLMLNLLKSERKEQTKMDKISDNRATRHLLPPVGTLVWHKENLFEVVSASRLRVYRSGNARGYCPRNGRALLCLSGKWTGAFNAAPSPLSKAIEGKNQNGWKVMRYSPTRLGCGENSEAALRLLESNKAYLCEVPKSGSFPAPIPAPELEELIENIGSPGLYEGRRVDDEVPLETFMSEVESVEDSKRQEEAPAQVQEPEDVLPGIAALVETPPEVKPAVFTELIRELQALRPSVVRFENLKQQLHQEIGSAQIRLLEEWRKKKISLLTFARSLVELEQLEDEF